MLSRKIIIGGIASFGFLFGLVSSKVAAEMPTSQHSQSTQFRSIEQPLWIKGAVTVGGLALVGLELWWFILSKPKSQKAEAHDGLQKVNITVDGGYEPSRVVVNANQRVQLNFLRRDASSCLEEIRFPDFHIAKNLPLNQVTTIEFTPEQPGTYSFTCGMNMFRGVIEVQSAEPTPIPTSTIVADKSDRIIALRAAQSQSASKTYYDIN